MRHLIFFYLLFTTFSGQANVSVEINNQTYHFAQNPRLAEVLAKVAGDRHWYWPASALYRLDPSRVERQRNEVIDQLKFMQLSLSGNHAAQITYLVEQIKHWTLAERIEVAIDYDAAQMDANKNPRFENGEYRLVLKLRPSSAYVIGLEDHALSIDLSKQQCAHTHIQQLTTDLANKDIAYIIQANGISQKVGLAYWNKGCLEIMPGSQIFLPLLESQFFNENRLLNEKIVALVKNRIVL
jgi:hypothetical protein